MISDAVHSASDILSSIIVIIGIKIAAKESEGAVLFIRLWQTTLFDLKRELFVIKQLGKTVKGVVVLQN